MIEAAIPFPNIDPELVRFGPVAIRWYALAYIAGLLLGWYYVVRLLRNAPLWEGPPFKGKPPATADHIGDIFVWLTIGVILGLVGLSGGLAAAAAAAFVAAFLNAAFDYCLGCQLYLLLVRAGVLGRSGRVGGAA